MRPDDTGRGPGRRAFVVGMAATFATRVAAAQPQRGPLPHRIGWISTETEPDPFIDGFREGLRRHGYVEGQNLVLELRYTRDLDVLRKAVAELAQSKVAFIVASGPAIRAIRAARDIPVLPFAGAAQLDAGLSAVHEAKANAMVVFPEGATMMARARITQFARAQRLPAMFGWSEYTDAGGLMSYGAQQRDAYVRLAAYADRLLRGAKPADLPIEQPTTFELVINLKTARALGLTIPQSLLQRADRILE